MCQLRSSIPKIIHSNWFVGRDDLTEKEKVEGYTKAISELNSLYEK